MRRRGKGRERRGEAKEEARRANLAGPTRRLRRAVWKAASPSSPPSEAAPSRFQRPPPLRTCQTFPGGIMAATPSAAAALSRLRSALSRRRGRLPWWSRSWPGAPWGRPSCGRLLSGGRCLSQASDPFLRGSYGEVSRRAAEAPGAFWGALAREALLWDAAHHTDCEWDFAQGRVRWFLGGRLNVAVNCLDRYAQHSPERVALIWEKDEPGTEEKVTYSKKLAVSEEEIQFAIKKKLV
uniref:Acetyl-coenzyme A synthetase N-terminal domain-containing protein n=1 Tax=Podarcis muralis TaxID=64176 RepID=A0A670HQK0_PODMU